MPDSPNTETVIPYVRLDAHWRHEREEILACVERVFESGQFVDGPDVGLLESELRAWTGSKHVVALSSGTDALMLGMRGLGIGPGDEVITPPNSFVASTATIVQVGATPVFADVGQDQNIDAAAVERAITPRTKAIMPVHLTGRVCDMSPLLTIARRHNLLIVEDAAQAIGSRYDGRLAGSFGTVGCFSGHPLKNLAAAGDAGFVATDDEDFAARMRRLRNHGLANRDVVSEFGFVSRLDSLQAAILRLRLGKLPVVIRRRRRHAELYRELLDARHVYSPPCRPIEFNTFHTFVIQVDRRNALRAWLTARGIATGVHYPVPIHLQPAAGALGYKKGDFPVAERQAERILTLPVHQFMSEQEVAYVAEAINMFFAESR